jgi:hypothetical protein
MNKVAPLVFVAILCNVLLFVAIVADGSVRTLALCTVAHMPLVASLYIYLATILSVTRKR